jgi:hypothetical protein
MSRAIAVLVLAACLSACNPIGAAMDGMKYAKAVEADLEATTGVRPAVGFNWHNGRLTSVTVLYPTLYKDKPLPELAEAARAAVLKEFKQTPEAIVLSFALGKATPGTTADASATH